MEHGATIEITSSVGLLRVPEGEVAEVLAGAFHAMRPSERVALIYRLASAHPVNEFVALATEASLAASARDGRDFERLLAALAGREEYEAWRDRDDREVLRQAGRR